jgi:hypothetical protein
MTQDLVGMWHGICLCAALSAYCLLTASFGRKMPNDLGRRSYAAVGRLVICRQLSNRWCIS